MLNDVIFDQLVAGFYKAATGEEPWGVVLERLRQAMGARVANVYGVDKSTQSVVLSFEVGDVEPQAALDFIRHYHHIEPRAHLLMDKPVGQLISCHKHFDDNFVAHDRFYQEFLIAYGMRYSTGAKIYEDEHTVVFCGIHRGLGTAPLNDAEEGVVRRLSVHLQQAMAIYLRQQQTQQPASVGLELLKRLPQPLMLVDETRHIVFANEPAQRLLDTGAVLKSRHGVLSGPQAADDAQLLIALRTLVLSDGSYLGDAPPLDKIFLRLQNTRDQRLGLYLYALRSGQSMGMFGPRNLAMVLLHDPSAQTALDPFVIAATWDLTPAEAKVAVAIGLGKTIAEVAEAHQVTTNTVRTQVRGVMAKMGVSRQAELVGMLSNLPPTLVSGD